MNLCSKCSYHCLNIGFFSRFTTLFNDSLPLLVEAEYTCWVVSFKPERLFHKPLSIEIFHELTNIFGNIQPFCQKKIPPCVKMALTSTKLELVNVELDLCSVLFVFDVAYMNISKRCAIICVCFSSKLS